jgi:hypothetical protein
MMNRSILVLAIVVLLWIGTGTDARYSGGTGEPNDPYQIATAEDLNDIGNHQEDWDKHFVLVNDVNLAEYTGMQFKIIGNGRKYFSGVFDGNDHIIHNAFIVGGSTLGVGLFGYVGAHGQVRNLGVENIRVTGGDCVGGLVGVIDLGSLTSCYFRGNVYGSGEVVGGLVGWNYRGHLANCYELGYVGGDAFVGGLVGQNSWGPLTNCYASGNVGGTGNCVGGLVGFDDSGSITNCYSTGRVSGGGFLGGLVGENYHSTITNCYSTGSVSGTLYVGGLAGDNNGKIWNCYSTGRVSGTNSVGGLVGYNPPPKGVVMASFWDIETSGRSTSAGGTPKTTAEMKTIDTFTDAGWDFVEIWGIGENQTYPFLRQSSACDINLDQRVDLQDFAIFAEHWLEGP